MQTFLPFPSFAKSAKVLDRRRLNNQRNEALILLKSLLGLYEGRGWRSHYVAKMWAGYEGALADYGTAICYEAIARGTNCTVLDQIEELIEEHDLNTRSKPPWLGKGTFHVSMRAELFRKDPDWYEQFHWHLPSNLKEGVHYPPLHIVGECLGPCRRFWLDITHRMCPFCAGELELKEVPHGEHAQLH